MKDKQKAWGIAMAKQMFRAHRAGELKELSVCLQNIYPQSEVNECDYNFPVKNHYTYEARV